MNLFLIYAAMKQKSEESRNVILIVTGLLAVCMMNKEGYLVNCDGAESDGNFTTSSAPGTCTGQLLAACPAGQVRNASTGACQDKAPLPSNMSDCVAIEGCCGSNAVCSERPLWGDSVNDDESNVCGTAGLLGLRTKTCTCRYSPSNAWTEGSNNNCDDPPPPS